MNIISNYSYKAFLVYPLFIASYIVLLIYRLISHLNSDSFSSLDMERVGFSVFLMLIGIGLIFYLIGKYKSITITNEYISIASPYYKKREFRKEDVLVKLGDTSSRYNHYIRTFTVISDAKKAVFNESDYSNYPEIIQFFEDHNYKLVE